MKSSKQLSLIGAAVAAALGTNAYALGPTAWATNTLFYTGGGSAEVQAVYSAVLRCLTSTTVDVYTDGTGTTKHPQSQSYLILSGTTNGTCGSAGVNIGFFYKYNGGSFPNGVQPQLASGSTLLAYPTVAQLGTASVLSFSGTVSSVNPDYTFSSTPSGTIQPDWGISDEEAALFAYFWNTNNAPLKPPIPNGTPGLWVAPFGIAVTANVYAEKKKWSRGEIAAVYQGANGPLGITAWTQLMADSGSPMTLAGGIALLDRGSGSGTKAAVNQYFLDYPSSSFSAGGAGQPNSVVLANANAGYTGATLVTSGAATSSYQDIKEGSSVSITDDLNAAQVAGIGAIGALGLEFPPLFEQTTAGTNSYFFVAINGTYPDTQTAGDNINSATAGSTHYTNVVNGSYDFATQVGFQHKNGIPAGFEAGVVANMEASTISGAATGSAFPTSAEGVLLDPATTGTTTAGNVNWTKGGNTAAQPVFAIAVAAAAAVPLASQ
jgi:hypothetical protein